MWRFFNSWYGPKWNMDFFLPNSVNAYFCFVKDYPLEQKDVHSYHHDNQRQLRQIYG